MSTLLRHLIEGSDLVVASRDDTIREAAKRMGGANVGCVAVVGKGNRLEGIFTERDILKRVLLRDLDVDAVHVADVMTTQITTAPPDMLASHALVILKQMHIRHLPVVDDGIVLGVLSIRDLTADQVRHTRESIAELNRYIQS